MCMCRRSFNISDSLSLMLFRNVVFDAPSKCEYVCMYIPTYMPIQYLIHTSNGSTVPDSHFRWFNDHSLVVHYISSFAYIRMCLYILVVQAIWRSFGEQQWRGARKCTHTAKERYCISFDFCQPQLTIFMTKLHTYAYSALVLQHSAIHKQISKALYTQIY